MRDDRPFRLGFFAYLEGDKPQAEVYAEALEVFVAADELGFDIGWVAQHHFGHHGGLPSPFLFFTALAERTRSMAFGTAVVTLPLENPIRVAEDAAVFESLYPGRLHLGVGTGIASPQVMATFDRANGDRRQLYDEGLARLLAALAGQPVNDDGDVLNPPAPDLLNRIWEAPASPDRVAQAARRGSGLLLSRVAFGTAGRPSHEIQVPLVNRYLEELPVGIAPRVGLSRTVYPSRRPDVAFNDLQVGLELALANSSRPEDTPKHLTTAERFKLHNIHYGAPDAVIESLTCEPLLGQTTNLICQVQPGLPSLAQTIDAIELIATEVAPAFGWHPARAIASSMT